MQRPTIFIQPSFTSRYEAAVADPEGVHWVPWNPSFEGLPSKILCANVLTLELRTLVAMPDVQNFFHKALAVIIAKAQHLYFRRKLLASSIE